MSPGFHLVLLDCDIPPLTHFQQYVASSGSSEGNGATISVIFIYISHFHFCIFDEIVTMNEKVNLNIQSCYLNFFLDLIVLF